MSDERDCTLRCAIRGRSMLLANNITRMDCVMNARASLTCETSRRVLASPWLAGDQLRVLLLTCKCARPNTHAAHMQILAAALSKSREDVALCRQAQLSMMRKSRVEFASSTNEFASYGDKHSIR